MKTSLFVFFSMMISLGANAARSTGHEYENCKGYDVVRPSKQEFKAGKKLLVTARISVNEKEIEVDVTSVKTGRRDTIRARLESTFFDIQNNKISRYKGEAPSYLQEYKFPLFLVSPDVLKGKGGEVYYSNTESIMFICK